MTTQVEQSPDIPFVRSRPALDNGDEPFRQSLADLSRQLASRVPIEPPPELDPKIADPPEPRERARRTRRFSPWLGVLALVVGFGIAAVIRALPGPSADAPQVQRPVAAAVPP